MKYFSVFSILFFASAALAAPISLPREVSAEGPRQHDITVNPHITSPQQNDVWKAGSHQTVRWDTDKIPKDRVVADGLVVLGYTTEGSEDEHLDLEHPLASGFSLADGSVDVVIPANEDSRKEFFIVLFGNSGNVSPTFTIDQSP